MTDFQNIYSEILNINNISEFNNHDQKIWRNLAHDMRKHWTTVSTFRLIGHAVTSKFLVTWVQCGFIFYWLSFGSEFCGRRLDLLGADDGIHRWSDLIRSKQLSTVSVCRAHVFAGFSGYGNSIVNINPLLEKRKCKTILPSIIKISKIENCSQWRHEGIFFNSF